MIYFSDNEIKLLWILAHEGQKMYELRNNYEDFWFSKSQARELVEKMEKVAYKRNEGEVAE